MSMEDRFARLEGRYYELFEKSIAGIAKLTSQVETLEGRFVRVDKFLDDIDGYLQKREDVWRDHIAKDLEKNLSLAIAEMKADGSVFSVNKKLNTRQIVAIISAIGTAIATVIAAKSGVF